MFIFRPSFLRYARRFISIEFLDASNIFLKSFNIALFHTSLLEIKRALLGLSEF